MSWIGLRDKVDGVFSPAGLSRPTRAPFDLNAVLPVGTLMIEFASDPRTGVQTIVEYGSCHPWAAGLIIQLTASGRLSLEQWQGQDRKRFSFETGLVSPSGSVLVTYSWDAPRRKGVLAVDVSDGGPLLYLDLLAPLPMSKRDALRIMADHSHCRFGDGLCFAAIADEIVPIGVMPGLAPQSLVSTPQGYMPVAELRAGQIVHTANGSTAQVRWCGAATLPARGRFAPLVLRAPYHGLLADLTVSPDQRLRMNGAEVDYLFDKPTVAVRAGDMRDDRGVRAAHVGKTHTYHQILLDRAAPMRIAGMVVEGLDITGLRRDPALRSHTILSQMPAELLPACMGGRVPVLQYYEALTLRKLLAA